MSIGALQVSNTVNMAGVAINKQEGKLAIQVKKYLLKCTLNCTYVAYIISLLSSWSQFLSSQDRNRSAEVSLYTYTCRSVRWMYKPK